MNRVSNISAVDRLHAIAESKRPVTATCRLAIIREQNVQTMYFKRLLREYQVVPDNEKEQWLHEQETT